MLTEKPKDAHAPAPASSHGAPISIGGSIAYFEGDYVPLADAKVSIMTHAFMYGTAVFEGIRAYWNAEQGVLYGLKLREHMERIRRNAGILLMGDLPAVDELVRIVVETARRTASVRTPTSGRASTSRASRSACVCTSCRTTSSCWRSRSVTTSIPTAASGS